MRSRWTPLFLLVAVACHGAPARARPLRVMLDPGHGGTNLGARGPGGALEKRITLRAARFLARELAGKGARVFMTRERDVYVSLAARVRRANAARADLMVSLHCNASPRRDQRGYEAFVVPPEPELAYLSASEPSWPMQRLLHGWASHLAVRRTLQDLRSRALRHRSLGLGGAVMSSLRRALGPAGDRGLQQAAFDVLLGLNMPGVLVEMGFLDHPREGRQLQRRAYLLRIVQALAAGILSFARHALGRAPREDTVRLTEPSRPPERRRPRDRRRPYPHSRIWPRRLRPQVALEPAA